MRLAALSTRACLLIALGGAVLATGVSAGIEWWGITHLRAVIASVRDGDVALADALANLHDDVLQLRRYEKDVLINVGSAEGRDAYRTKWDDTLLRLRYDLARTRAVAPPSAGPQLRAFEESVAQYRSVFSRTYAQIRDGSVSTTQQANAELGVAKEAAHHAEQQIFEIEQHARLRMAQLGDPVANARWASLALNLALFAAIGGPLAWAMRQKPGTLTGALAPPASGA